MTISFTSLKLVALKCRDESKGHILTSSFRLHYNMGTNTVNLISHFNDSILASTTSSNNTLFKALDVDLSQPAKSKIFNMYGVAITSLKGCKGIKLHQANSIKESYQTLYPRTFIYVANTMVINSVGKVIHAGNYKETIINKEWNKKYTRISKKHRANFHALNIILPKSNTITPMFTFMYSSHSNNMAITKIVINTLKPTCKQLLKIRGLIEHPVVNMRTFLQKVLNATRLNMAITNNETKTYIRKNDPY